MMLHSWTRGDTTRALSGGGDGRKCWKVTTVSETQDGDDEEGKA